MEPQAPQPTPQPPKIGPIKYLDQSQQAAPQQTDRVVGKTIQAPPGATPVINSAPAVTPQGNASQITLYKPLPKGVVVIAVLGLVASVYGFSGATLGVSTPVYQVEGLTLLVGVFLYMGLLLRSNISRVLLILLGILTIGLHLYIIDQNRSAPPLNTDNKFYHSFYTDQASIIGAEVLVVLYLSSPTVRKIYS